jgi:hypothetical protein
LRRRRRQSTQIIHKKTTSSPSASSYYSSPKPKRRGKKILSFIAIVIILSAISYYFYNLNFQKDNAPLPESESETISTTPIEPPEDEGEEEQTPPPLAHTIQVEILNGCGVNGVAKIFQSRLRENGFDVVNTENYVVNGKVFWKVDQTFVIDQIGVAEQAKAIAKALGIPLTNIESRENPAAIYDISVVVGKDYRNYIQ